MPPRWWMMAMLSRCTECDPAADELPSDPDSGWVDSGVEVALERALWVWDVPFGEADAEQALVDRAKRDGFTTLYLSDYAPDPSHHALLARAHAAGLRVHALAGDPSWAARPGRSADHVRAVERFNRAGEPYDAIQHDTEFYLLDTWSSDRSGTLASYVREVRGAAEASDVPFTVALPFWLAVDEYGAVANEVDGVALMAYRDSAPAIVEVAWEEVARSVPCVVGVELRPTAEPEYVSFAEEGKGALESALTEVESAFAGSPGFAGVAIHDASAWWATP